MILWLNPRTGISGDMLLAALIDLGAPIDAIRDAIASTGIDGWSLDANRVSPDGISAVQVAVGTDANVAARAATELLDIVGRARPAPVADIATRAVRAIAEVEATLHDTELDELHLHEIGGLDTVVDTVGVAAALGELGVTAVHSSAPVLGTGSIESAHGRIPIPAPATMALLRDLPCELSSLSGETVTPTGAALLRALDTRFVVPPPARLVATGYGAGSRRFPGVANVLPASLLDPLDVTSGAGEPMTLVQTTVDDVTGEVVGFILERLLEDGAADAWAIHGVGKKGRPVMELNALCPPDRATTLELLLLAETGSLGARRIAVDRHALVRSQTVVSIGDERIRVKVGPHRSKPEYDDLAALARSTGRPLRELTELVARAVADDADTTSS